MDKTVQALLPAREMNEAPPLYWLETAAPALAAYAAAFIAFNYGLGPGLALVALFGLTRLRPRLNRLPSPDGRRQLLDCQWAFGRVFFLAGVVGLNAGIGLLLRPLELPSSLLVALALFLAASALTLMFIPVLTDHAFPWEFHLVLIREDGRTRTWHGRICVSRAARTQYLWLPDSRSLLVAQSDEEECWYLYHYDPEAVGGGHRYPYNKVVGHYPHLRRLTLEEAQAQIAGSSSAQPYACLCRRFFAGCNPQPAAPEPMNGGPMASYCRFLG